MERIINNFMLVILFFVQCTATELTFDDSNCLKLTRELIFDESDSDTVTIHNKAIDTVQLTIEHRDGVAKHTILPQETIHIVEDNISKITMKRHCIPYQYQTSTVLFDICHNYYLPPTINIEEKKPYAEVSKLQELCLKVLNSHFNVEENAELEFPNSFSNNNNSSR